ELPDAGAGGRRVVRRHHVPARRPTERGVWAVEDLVSGDEPWPGRIDVWPRCAGIEQRIHPEHVPDTGHPVPQEETVEGLVDEVRVHIPEAGNEVLPPPVEDRRPG